MAISAASAFIRSLNRTTSNDATLYYSRFWQADANACPSSLRRFGPAGEGGKVVCDSERLLSASQCLVVSVGLNNDTRAEQALHKGFPNCAIEGYDGTLSEKKRKMLPPPDVLKFIDEHRRKHSPKVCRQDGLASQNRLRRL